jgi:hypothetical protein
LNSGFCFDFCCSINLWIGPWYAWLDIDSAAREAQSVNIFYVLFQILGSCAVKTMNRFRFESGCQISELLTNHFSLMSALCVSSLDGTESQRKSTSSIENVQSHHLMSKQLCPLRIALRTGLFPPIRWKRTVISPSPVCYLWRAQTLSLFPHTRFNQWKFAY